MSSLPATKARSRSRAAGSTLRTFGCGVRVAVTAAIVIVPFGGLAVAVWFA
jgi:hypothetical protein